MRVVILHESPAADSLVREFVEAVQEFNRSLDFRLRFLDVGFTVRTVPVAPGGEVPAVLLDGTLRRFQPGVVLVLGGGLNLLECASLAAKHRTPLAYYLDGEPERDTAAIARLARVLLSVLPREAVPLAPDAVFERVAGEVSPAASIVRLLVRSVRNERPGTPGRSPSLKDPPS